MKCEICGARATHSAWSHMLCPGCHRDWHVRAPTTQAVEAKYGLSFEGLCTGYQKFTEGWLAKRRLEQKAATP